MKRQVSSDQVFECSKYISIQVLEYSGIKVFKYQEYQAEVKMQGQKHNGVNNGRRYLL